MIASFFNLLTALVFLSTALIAIGPAAAADGCLDNRSVQAMIGARQIRTWPAIKAMAGISDDEKEVSAVRVCEQDGTPYYVVNVAGPSGQSEQLVLNAVTGSP